jgi:hypothetical protein
MPIGEQPADRRGTVGRPYSALNLRLVLAWFGAVTSVIFAVLLFRAGMRGFGWVLLVLAAVAVIDLVVIGMRRRARRRAGGQRHSLFE